jgi:hypothetical protein
MSVIVMFRGRLGNNLFQYALGRLIAEHHGFALECGRTPEPPMTFMGRDVDIGPPATLEALQAYFPHAPLCLPGTCVDAPVDAYEYSREGWGGHTVDLQAILADRTPRRILLDGFFQRVEYFRPHRERLRRWFEMAPVQTPHAIEPRDVLVSIRRGIDFGMQEWALSLAYYERVLAGLANIGQVYVCGTCIDDQVRRALEPFRPIYHHGTPIEHFAFMQRFSRIVLSNSTFAWWAAWLSDAREIYAPRSVDRTIFGLTGYLDVDLHMGDDRYIEIEDGGTARFAPFELVSDGATLAPLDEDARVLLSWMKAQNGPIPMKEIRAQAGRLNLHKAFRALIEAGLVAAAPRYLEPPAHS